MANERQGVRICRKCPKSGGCKRSEDKVKECAIKYVMQYKNKECYCDTKKRKCDLLECKDYCKCTNPARNNMEKWKNSPHEEKVRAYRKLMEG